MEGKSNLLWSETKCTIKLLDNIPDFYKRSIKAPLTIYQWEIDVEIEAVMQGRIKDITKNIVRDDYIEGKEEREKERKAKEESKSKQVPQVTADQKTTND